MKVSSISTPKFVKNILISAPLLLSPISNIAVAEQPSKDTFERTITQENVIKIHDTNVLAPNIKIGEQSVLPSIVIDKSENKLYLYNSEGYLEKSYTVGLGKTTTPTVVGIRKIVKIESYPYSKAPKITKRHQSPSEYGPNVIVVGIVDPKTGEITGYDGKFIHGTNKPDSIGKNESKGCVRMNNEDVKELASQLKAGQFVLIRE